MPGPKTNEREGTRAVLRHCLVSPYKLREVVDAIRGKPVHEAADLLRFVERDAASIVGKLLASAVANAANNDGLDPEELFVSACYVDEGPTAKRWRPRARGRAARIRKRSAHITVIVSRLPEDRLARLQARRRAENLAMRARRVEATRQARAETTEGASRRERRHPEAFPAPEPETTEGEGTAETTETTSTVGTTEEPETTDATETPETAETTETTGASGTEEPVVAETEAAPAPVPPEAQAETDGDEEKDS
jgi:large subunit ribosomal protein L22